MPASAEATRTARARLSPDGFELRFAVNYLSGFLLTHLLLPLIKNSAPARIVNVSSLGQQAIDFKDVMMTHDYSGMRAYRQSKLAQILFTIDLAPELQGSGVTVNALHPATFMNTNMVREFGTPMTTVEEGADAILKLAIARKSKGGAGCFSTASAKRRRMRRPMMPRPGGNSRTLSLELAGLVPAKAG